MIKLFHTSTLFTQLAKCPNNCRAAGIKGFATNQAGGPILSEECTKCGESWSPEDYDIWNSDTV